MTRKPTPTLDDWVLAGRREGPRRSRWLLLAGALSGLATALAGEVVAPQVIGGLVVFGVVVTYVAEARGARDIAERREAEQRTLARRDEPDDQTE